MTLRYAGITYEHREVLLRDKPHAMLAVSTKGTVPVWVDVDGRVIDESIDIMRWALAQNDPEGWRNADLVDLTAVDDLVAALESDFKPHLDGFKYGNRLPEARWLPHRNACESFLDQLEQKLAGNAYLYGATLGYADVALFPFVRQFAYVDADWFSQYAAQALPKLKNWLEALLALPLFLEVMHKVPQWRAEVSAYQSLET